MSENNLTKIFCAPADSQFVILYLRFKELKKHDLNLVSWNKSFKICDARIKSELLRSYQEYKELKIDLSDFFNVNILKAQCKRRNNEFTLQKTTFEEDREVKFGTMLVPIV